ncbi:MAG: YkgJ family cysteine cluster protein [Promethearchaeota archaeon]|nr:MAG: YkgJ family cysteine cluster protein [Candidatus Lokiarchaeota archaeon]
MEKNLNKIKSLGKAKKDENYKFRAFLKVCDLTMEEVDEIVHRLYEKYASQMDCRECANCCKVLGTVVDDDDIERLAERLGMSPAEFEEQYVEYDPSLSEKSINIKPCPFLKDNRCQYYDVRPKECAAYPYLHKPYFSARTLGVIENYSVCPLVFNVYEALKAEIWHK